MIQIQQTPGYVGLEMVESLSNSKEQMMIIFGYPIFRQTYAPWSRTKRYGKPLSVPRTNATWFTNGGVLLKGFLKVGTPKASKLLVILNRETSCFEAFQVWNYQDADTILTSRNVSPNKCCKAFWSGFLITINSINPCIYTILFVSVVLGWHQSSWCLGIDDDWCLIWLVVWTCFIFPSIGNFIIPTDELHHFSEG